MLRPLRLATALLLAHTVAAFDFKVEVDHAWVRATLPGQGVSGAYFELLSHHDARLIKVETPAAAMAELHEMKLEQGVMKMRPLEAIDLPAGKPVSLQPNGLHVMLMNLRQPLKAGTHLPLTLTFRQEGQLRTLKIDAEVVDRRTLP